MAVRYRATAWHRDHRFAVTGIVAATVLTVVTGFLGPSVIALTLGPRHSLLPPYYLPDGSAEPNEWLVSSMIWAAILVGAAGLLIGLRALAAGWRPRPWRIFALGTGLSIATVLVPPLTSADVLMYAAYGRLQVIGRDPYSITPAEIFRSQFDPVLTLVEPPWADTPSVYGPITSFSQLLANRLGGESMHDIVFWLQLFALIPFLLTGLGVMLLARGGRGAGADTDERRAQQARAALFLVANPCLIWAVLAGAHNEALSVVFAVAALLLVRRSPFGAGLAIGLAGCAKLSIGLYGIAMLWAYRREPKKALLLCLGAALPMVAGYVLWQPTAFFQVLRNGGYVSVGSWANPVFRFFDWVYFSGTTAKIIVGVASYLGLFVIGFLLSRLLPWKPAPGLPAGVDPRQDPLTVALRSALVISVAWLVTAMYTLSWYDLIAWVPLAVLGSSVLDLLLVVRIAPLSLAYVPGRSIDFGPALDLTSTRIRDTVSPIVQLGVLAAIVVWWWRTARGRSRTDTAAVDVSEPPGPSRNPTVVPEPLGR